MPLLTLLQATADTTGPFPKWGHGHNAASRLDTLMLAEDKLYVVLAVVLIIWIGLMLFMLRTDRKLAALERLASEQPHEE